MELSGCSQWNLARGDDRCLGQSLEWRESFDAEKMNSVDNVTIRKRKVTVARIEMKIDD